MKRLHKLWNRGCHFLNAPYAILGGAMTWVSNPTLVASISNAGGFGVLASGSVSPEELSALITETKKKTSGSFGVNLITLHPKLNDLIDVCLDHKISHIVLAGGIPTRSLISKIKEGGSRSLAFTPTVSIAQNLRKIGVDALIIEGSEAGGHIGPVSTSVLAQIILPVISEIPVFVAGGIGTGEGIVMYLQMGASGCQLGTRFVCSFDSPAHSKMKKTFIQAEARDTIVSPNLDERFPVIPVRSIANKAIKDFIATQKQIKEKIDSGQLSLKEGQLMVEHFWAGSLRRAVIEGDIENGSLMAGQSVSFVNKEESTKEIIDSLIAQALNFLDRQSKAA